NIPRVLRPPAQAELRGRATRHAAKVAREIKLIAVAALARDFLDGILRIEKPPLRLGDAFAAQPVDGTRAQRSPKTPGKSRHAEAAQVRQFHEPQRQVKIEAHPLQGGPNGF